MSPAPSRIVIAAGGTAGHVVPALAVADALRAEGAQVSFIGGERAEQELVPAAGYRLERISVEGISRSNPLRAARALARAGAAIAHGRALLAELSPDAVLGAGGYVAAPVGAAALSLRVPLVLSEADSHLGLANRMLAPFARRVCLAFPIAGRTGPRYRVTGRPGPPPAERELARERFALAPGERCVLVFGGSLGAHSINQAAIGALAGGPFRVLHVSGRRDYQELELAARELPGGYELRAYLPSQEFSQALAAADLVIARAGGSVFEIASHGVPAILVPYPHATGDHQSANARWMAEAGAAVVISDGQLSAERLADQVAELLGDPARLAAMASAARALARPQAAFEVAAELLQAASR